MIRLLSKIWWILVLRGVLGVVFGLLALGWPGQTLLTLVLFFGAYSLIDGVFGILSSVRNWREHDDHWLLLLSGIAGVGIGIITLRSPETTALVLVMYIAAWMLVTGVLNIAAAIRLRKEMEGEIWLALSGVLSIASAFLLWLFPAAGALGAVWLIGSYAIAFGISLMVLGFRLRGRGEQLSGAQTPA